MTDRSAEARALLRSMAELSGDPYGPFVAEFRQKVDQEVRPKLPTPTSDHRNNARNDLQAILDPDSRKLSDAEREAALTVWIDQATSRLGRLADAARARAKAEQDPGRDRALGDTPLAGDELAKQTHDDLVEHRWIARCADAASAVGYVRMPRYFGPAGDGHANGTMFAIGGDLVMTAYHVVHARDRSKGEALPPETDRDRQVADCQWAFDYHDVTRDAVSQPIATLARGATLLWHDETLDVAVLRLSQAPPASVKPVRFHDAELPSVTGSVGFAANIIQHPNGEQKKVGLRNNAVWKIEPTKLMYFTDTRGGSSGAPVFLDNWTVIAVHTGWDSITSARSPIYMGRTQAFINRGARSSAVLAALRARPRTDPPIAFDVAIAT